VISGLGSDGSLYFTINKGTNNSETLIKFLLKLVNHLDSVLSDWRTTTVLMFYKALYHRSDSVLKLFETLKLPIMFLGPYIFNLAPVEKFFSYIKSAELKNSTATSSNM
jgi:transposase